MKKLMILSIALLAAVALAVPAFASTSTWTANDATNVVTLGSGSGSGGVINTYGLSNNVYLKYSTDDVNMNYVIGAVHKSGNRGYGAASSTTLMYYQSKNTGDTSVDGLPDPGTAASFATGTWTAGP